MAASALAFVVALTWSADAEARVLTSDDAMFSLDLDGATVCIIEPPSLRSDEECAGLDLAAFPAPTLADPFARIAHGVVRGAGQGAARPILGIVTMMRGPSHATAPPDQVSAQQIGEETGAIVSASVPAGTRLLPATTKIAWGKNVPVVRTTFVAEGLDAANAANAANDGSAGSAANAASHESKSAVREAVTAMGGRYIYTTVWSGDRAHGAELARLADAAAATTDLKPEGRPVTKLNPWPGRILFFFGVAGLMLLRFRKKRPPEPKPPTG